MLPQGLYFGSELKCLRVAGVPTDIDADALRLFFQFTYIPEPLSCFRAVRKLPAGTSIQLTTMLMEPSARGATGSFPQTRR